MPFHEMINIRMVQLLGRLRGDDTAAACLVPIRRIS
jgi:hypothetical protein